MGETSSTSVLVQNEGKILSRSPYKRLPLDDHLRDPVINFVMKNEPRCQLQTSPLCYLIIFLFISLCVLFLCRNEIIAHTFSLSPETPLEESERLPITVILQGYSPKRLQNYVLIGERYSRIFDQFILVWNGAARDQVAQIMEPYGAEIMFMNNSVHNRFMIADRVHNEVVLIVDDDVYITYAGARCMLSAWSRNHDRMIGCDRRKALPMPDGGLRYKQPKNYDFHASYGLIIGKTMMFHKKYMETYQTTPDWLLKETDFKADDILMNAYVSNATGLPPLVVESVRTAPDWLLHWVDEGLLYLFEKTPLRIDLPQPDGLSSSKSGKTWLKIRSDSLVLIRNYFSSQIYVETDKTWVCDNDILYNGTDTSHLGF